MLQSVVGDVVEYTNIPQALILLLCVVVFFIVVVIVFRRRSSGIKGVFESQALKRNGSVTGMRYRYKLTFMHHDCLITVSESEGGKYQGIYTEVVTKMQKSGLPSMKIYSKTLTSEIGKKVGMQDIQINRSEFDEKFIIKGSDESFIRNLLASNVQDKLLKLLSYKPVITLEDNELTVNVPIVLDTEEEYDLLIDSALAIIDRLNEI